VEQEEAISGMPSTKAFPLSLLIGILFSEVHAEGWTCRNDVEVQCMGSKCEARIGKDFTPMAVSFDSEGKFRVCAYTGCWAGKARPMVRAPFLVITQAQVDWSDPNRRVVGREDVLIAFDFNDKWAVVKAGTLAVPMLCSKEP
jgi:hypothetical protein